VIDPNPFVELTRPASGEPFCFVRGRMKHIWRRADHSADGRGRPVDGTIGASRARRYWSDLLSEVLLTDAVYRVRNRNSDAPVVMMSESRYRALEAAAIRNHDG
jgi:hypothetical protein